jgi:hypothetical protein
VISNKDIQQGAAVAWFSTSQLLISFCRCPGYADGDGSWTLEAFIADMNNGGPASQAITSNMNVKRTPRGQG